MRRGAAQPSGRAAHERAPPGRVRVGVPLAVRVTLLDCDGVAESEALREGVREGVRGGERLAVGVTEGVGVQDGVALGVGVWEDVSLTVGVWEGVTDPVAGALRDARAEGRGEGEEGAEGEPRGVAEGEPETDGDALVEGEPASAAAADAEAAALGEAPALPPLLPEAGGLASALLDRDSRAEALGVTDGAGAFEALAVADTLPLPRRDGELLPERLPVAAAEAKGAPLPLSALDALAALEGASLPLGEASPELVGGGEAEGGEEGVADAQREAPCGDRDSPILKEAGALPVVAGEALEGGEAVGKAGVGVAAKEGPPEVEPAIDGEGAPLPPAEALPLEAQDALAAPEGVPLPLLSLDALPVLDGAPLEEPQLLALVVMVAEWEPVGRAVALTGMHAALLIAARSRW